jgi:hypothetical protein
MSELIVIIGIGLGLWFIVEGYCSIVHGTPYLRWDGKLKKNLGLGIMLILWGVITILVFIELFYPYSKYG